MIMTMNDDISPDDHAHGDGEEQYGDNVNVFDMNEMIPYVDTILREDDKVRRHRIFMLLKILF